MPGRPDPERRNHRRRLRPLSCEIEIDGKVHSGVIRDLSPQGLFVTVRFESEPGAPVTLRVRRPGGEIWEVQATTARHADGSGGMISRRGVGLVIEEAPVAFHEFVAQVVHERRQPFRGDESFGSVETASSEEAASSDAATEPVTDATD
jgi:hypothetical protein